MPPNYICAGCMHLKKGCYCTKKDDYTDCFGYCPTSSWASPNTRRK